MDENKHFLPQGGQNNSYSHEYEREHNYIVDFIHGVTHLCRYYRNGFVFCGLSIELPAMAIILSVSGSEPAIKYAMFNTLLIWIVSLICIFAESAEVEKAKEEPDLFEGNIVRSVSDEMLYQIEAFVPQNDGSFHVIIKCIDSGVVYTVPEQSFENLFRKEVTQ